MDNHKHVVAPFKVYANALNESILQLIYLQYISQFRRESSMLDIVTFIRTPPISTVQHELLSPKSNIFRIVSKVSSLLYTDRQILDSLNYKFGEINRNDMHTIHHMFMYNFTNKFAPIICKKIHDRFHYSTAMQFTEWPDIIFDWDKLLSQEDNVISFIIKQTQLNIDVHLNYTNNDYPTNEPDEELIVLLKEDVIAELRSNASIVPLYIDVPMIRKYEGNYDNYIYDRLISFATDTHFSSSECTYIRPSLMSYWIHTNPSNIIEYHNRPNGIK